MSFKPTLASPLDLSKTTWPLYASPKLDGIRATVVAGQLLSRSLKPIQNRHISALLSRPEYNGLDGELIVGPATASDVFARSTSGVMGRDGEPDFTFHVFDKYDVAAPYDTRWYELYRVVDRAKQPFVAPLTQHLVHDVEGLDEIEARYVGLGYEGVITRRPDAPYKFGRSTPKEGYLSKVKRFSDSEALVIDVVEEMFNGNEAGTNELGRTKRSSAKAGKTGKNTMGALTVRDVTSGVEFNIGTGFTAAQRAGWWDGRAGHIGQTLVKYKFFSVGVVDAPRHPVYLGVRHKDDLS